MRRAGYRPARVPPGIPAAGCSCRRPHPRSEIEPQAVGVRAGADIDGQLSRGAELKIQRQPHDHRCHRILDVLTGDPLPRADQRVPGLLPHIGLVHRIDPVRHLPRAPQVLALHPGGRLARLSCPVSSTAPITSPPRRLRRAAPSGPAAANRRTWLIAVNVSQAARLSSRCVRPGVRSPPCRAIVHPFRLGSSLTSADTYFPACCHVPVRTKHDRSDSSSSARFRPASPALILAAAAAFQVKAPMAAAVPVRLRL
jgi:hypothetical protein